LRILQIIQRNQLRGAEVFACQLSEQLINLGHSVDVMILFGDKIVPLDYSIPFLFLQADEKKRWFNFKAYKKLAQVINENQYDIVQANAGDTLKYASLSKKLYKWNSTLIFRNANKVGDFLTTFQKRKINAWLMKEVDFVASVSHECLSNFLQFFPGFKNRIDYLPIGIKTTDVIENKSLTDIGIEGQGPFLLHVGSFMPEKNHFGLVNIFSNILTSYPDAKLLLIGEGKTKERIINVVSEKGLNKSILFLGQRKDVLSIMACCDMLVLPSLIEGLPGVILEAFLQKLPVIAYDVGGIKELINNNQTGWIVQKNNQTAFVEAIKKCLEYNNNVLKNNAYQIAINKFSINNISDRFLFVYNKLLAVQ
jgi:glycosyltransferase involved in cell wall biosynthesis